MAAMRVAIVTLNLFNEIDTFVALSILNRLSDRGVRAEICAPEPTIESMNGVCLKNVRPLEYATEANAVLIGSGRGTAQAAADPTLLARLKLEPTRQWIGSQCSGALLLAQLGLLKNSRACSDAMTRPMLEAAGVRVMDKAFHSEGHVATAGGCLASPYLAAWIVLREFGVEAVREALGYVAPVGEEEEFIQRALKALGASSDAAASPK